MSIAPSLFVQLLKLTIISHSCWVSVSVHVEVFAKLMMTVQMLKSIDVSLTAG